MYIEPEIKEWLPQGITEDELIAAIDSFNEAAKEYEASVVEAVNEINEEAVYESKWRKSE